MFSSSLSSKRRNSVNGFLQMVYLVWCIIPKLCGQLLTFSLYKKEGQSTDVERVECFYKDLPERF